MDGHLFCLKTPLLVYIFLTLYEIIYVGTHEKHLTEALLMNSITYVFMKK